MVPVATLYLRVRHPLFGTFNDTCRLLLCYISDTCRLFLRYLQGHTTLVAVVCFMTYVACCYGAIMQADEAVIPVCLFVCLRTDFISATS